MQLKKHNTMKRVKRLNTREAKKIGPALAAATCGVLGIASTPALAQGEPGTWDFDVANLYYAESDSRVTAVEPVFSATRYFSDDRQLNLKAVFDTLTGASPNGATPSDQVQTFTRTSGGQTYDVEANDAPLYDGFRDTRVALSASWLAPLNREWEYTASVYGSSEFDYTSIGTGGTIKRYLNNKNTALNTGLFVSFDTVNPPNGTPPPLAEMARIARNDSDDSKTIIDALFGVTQVINRQTIMQLNYSLSQSSGYLNDAYQLLSVIDLNPGLNYGGNFQVGGNNVYLYEARPDSRMKHSIYWQTKYALENGDVIDGSYRFMLDDWGINSHTFDFRYRWDLGGSYIEPHFRYYMQSKADFYQRYIGSDEYSAGNLTEATADYRLGDMDALTVGMKFGWKLKNNKEINTRIEYYLQRNTGDNGVGLLRAQDLYPDNRAIIFQVGYSF